MKFKALLLCSIGLLACNTLFAQIRYVHTADKTYPDINRENVRIYLDWDKVPDNAEEVGMILCHTDNENIAYKKARKIAANHGANAVYLLSEKEITNEEKWMNSVKGTTYRNKMKFIAVFVPLKQQ